MRWQALKPLTRNAMELSEYVLESLDNPLGGVVRYQSVSVSVNQLPLAVLTPEYLCHPKIHGEALFLAVHVNYGALDTYPVSHVLIGGRVQDLEGVLTTWLEQFCAMSICRINVLGTLDAIAVWSEESSGRAVRRYVIEWLKVAVHERGRSFFTSVEERIKVVGHYAHSLLLDKRRR